MHTSRIAGAMARTLGAASGFSRYTAASHLGKKNMIDENTTPMTVKVSSATRKSFCSCFTRPLASASATMRESATGRPEVARVKKTK